MHIGYKVQQIQWSKRVQRGRVKWRREEKLSSSPPSNLLWLSPQSDLHTDRWSTHNTQTHTQSTRDQSTLKKKHREYNIVGHNDRENDERPKSVFFSFSFMCGCRERRFDPLAQGFVFNHIYRWDRNWENLGLGFTHTRRHTLLPSAHALTCVRTVNSQRMPAFLPVCLTGWMLWATFDMNTVWCLVFST